MFSGLLRLLLITALVTIDGVQGNGYISTQARLPERLAGFWESGLYPAVGFTHGGYETEKKLKDECTLFLPMEIISFRQPWGAVNSGYCRLIAAEQRVLFSE